MQRMLATCLFLAITVITQSHVYAWQGLPRDTACIDDHLSMDDEAVNYMVPDGYVGIRMRIDPLGMEFDNKPMISEVLQTNPGEAFVYAEIEYPFYSCIVQRDFQYHFERSSLEMKDGNIGAFSATVSLNFSPDELETASFRVFARSMWEVYILFVGHGDSPCVFTVASDFRLCTGTCELDRRLANSYMQNLDGFLEAIISTSGKDDTQDTERFSKYLVEAFNESGDLAPFKLTAVKFTSHFQTNL